MKKFAIAYLSLFENQNIVSFTNGTDAVSAFKNWAINELDEGKFKNDADWIEWVKSSGDTVEQLKDNWINSDIAIDIKEIV